MSWTHETRLLPARVCESASPRHHRRRQDRELETMLRVAVGLWTLEPRLVLVCASCG